MSEWRYIITYEGSVEADTEDEAITEAVQVIEMGLSVPYVEVYETAL